VFLRHGKTIPEKILAFHKFFTCKLQAIMKSSARMQTENAPILQAPGAGLPWVENRIARILLGAKRAFGTPTAFAAQFRNERQKIEELIRSCDGAAFSRRVLIPRLPGLEDSSRYWSVAMTLDHLRIVNHAFVGILSALAAGNIPLGEASTAAVKPRADVGIEVIAAYEKSCDALLSCVAGIADFKTQARFPHPWFGPMDAHGWLALAAGHMGIHRRQIAKILAG
jgi:uncharacterized damage-inducible protein DinB